MMMKLIILKKQFVGREIGYDNDVVVVVDEIIIIIMIEHCLLRFHLYIAKVPDNCRPCPNIVRQKYSITWELEKE